MKHQFSIEYKAEWLKENYNNIFNKRNKIALVPYGEYSKKIKKIINNYKNFVFLDEDKNKIDNKTVFNLTNKEILRKLNYIIITSYTYYKVIENKLLQFGFPQNKIINLGYPLEIDSYDLKFLKIKNNFRELKNKIKNKSNIFLFIGPFFYDIYEKISIIHNYYKDTEIIWYQIGSKDELSFDSNYRFYKTNNLLELLKVFSCEKIQNKTFCFTIHPISYYNIVYEIKRLLHKIKIIPYIYDWLNLFCPYKYKDIYKKYRKLEKEECEEEYRSLEKIINGIGIKGIIFKDDLKNAKFLKNFTKPKLFFPAVKSKKLFTRINDKQENNINKIVFIGSIFSKKHYLSTLFKDAILFDIFEKVSNLGFNIDVYYYVNTFESVVKEYKKYFENNKRVSIIKGDLLENLFPKIVGKYGWGWMIYEDDYPIVKEHVKYTLPSKIFTYIALGVPIIVVNDFKSSAKLVKKYKIGITLNKEDIKNLPKIIKNVDYKQLLENIKIAREKFCLENYEKKFIHFLECVKNEKY